MNVYHCALNDSDFSSTIIIVAVVVFYFLILSVILDVEDGINGRSFSLPF